MNEQLRQSSLIQFNKALQALDSKLTLEKIQKYHFEETDTLVNVHIKETEETERTQKSTPLFVNIKQRNVVNPFKSKLLARLKN
jgi:hypothetical protein